MTWSKRPEWATVSSLEAPEGPDLHLDPPSPRGEEREEHEWLVERPQPRRMYPPRRCGARRAARRVGRRLALHEPRESRQGRLHVITGGAIDAKEVGQTASRSTSRSGPSASGC